MIHEETAGGGSRAASFVHVRFQWVCSCLGALAWQNASGRLPAPVSGMGRSPSVSSGPDPALPRNLIFFFFFLPTVTRFIGVASEVGFYSPPPFFSCPLPSPTRDPRIISFPRPCFEVVELSAPSDSGFLTGVCETNCRRHPPTHAKLKRSRKGLPVIQCLQQPRDHNIFK